MALLVLTQRPWNTAAVAELTAAVTAMRQLALRHRPVEEPVLVLLPHALAPPAAQRVTKDTLLAVIASVCRAAKVYLAGSAVVKDETSGVGSILAFLVSSSGEVLLRTPKISPELVNGFEDLGSAGGVPAAFAVVPTPFGQVGLLPGEDILFASYARALAFHGAELILNPAQERADALFEIRRLARVGRAGENSCYVATASPAAMMVGRESIALPAATGLHAFNGTSVSVEAGADCVYIDLDLELLRQARVNPQRSLPAIVRAHLYAHGYRRAATRARDTSEGSVTPAAASPTTAADWWREAGARSAATAYADSAEPPKHYEERYEALLVQDAGRLIPLDRSIDARAIMQRNLDDSLKLAGSRANVPTVRLVVFPEFWLTGQGESAPCTEP